MKISVMTAFILAALALGAATVAYGHEDPRVSYGYNKIPPGFATYTVERGDKWKNVAPNPKDDALVDPRAKLLIMKVNKIDSLRAGKKILIPVDESAYSFLPVPEKIPSPSGKRTMVVFLGGQWFGAYDESGSLYKWGPISSGRKGMRTPIGKFKAQDRYKRYVNRDGALMPYAVRIVGGIFFHQYRLPGYPASHGCVRLLMDDARNLNSYIRRGDFVRVVASAHSAL